MLVLVTSYALVSFSLDWLNVQNFTNCIYKNGSYLFLPKDQRRVFAEYYEDLSQPSNDNYDNSYLALCSIR
jgi:hypothetical protein